MEVESILRLSCTKDSALDTSGHVTVCVCVYNVCVTDAVGTLMARGDAFSDLKLRDIYISSVKSNGNNSSGVFLLEVWVH